MEMRYVGQSGLRVSKVGLGCNNFGQKLDLRASTLVMDAALDAGVTFFDTSDVYGNRGGSEACIGEALGERRGRVVLATKFSMPMDDYGQSGGGSRSYVIQAVEASLRRLKTDWIDLYQMHFPDPRTPLEETLRALDDLVTAGKVRYIGCSNFAGWQIADAAWISRTTDRAAFISAQNEYSLLFRAAEADVLPAVQTFGLGFLPYFPLASGLLTGKYRSGQGAAARFALRDDPFRRPPQGILGFRQGRASLRLRDEPQSNASRTGDGVAGGASISMQRHRRRNAARTGH